jgi:AcrR family transcriptional regulator
MEGPVPTPARTSLEAIVAAGRGIVDTEGLDGLTMARVAGAVGVRAPSLYKRVDGRPTLVRLVLEDVLRELTEALDSVAVTGDHRRDIVAVAHAFRDYARRRPHAYALIFAPLPEGARPDPDLLPRAAGPVLRAAAALAGPEHALEAARTVVAWAHGFLSMELGGGFQLGGDVDAAFSYGIERISLALGPAS